jgi:hypothetical protein
MCSLVRVKATIQAIKIKNPCKSMTYRGFCGEKGSIFEARYLFKKDLVC